MGLGAGEGGGGAARRGRRGMAACPCGRGRDVTAAQVESAEEDEGGSPQRHREHRGERLVGVVGMGGGGRELAGRGTEERLRVAAAWWHVFGATLPSLCLCVLC